MAGISSKALSFGNPENKNEKFQGQPLDDELGLNWYGFKWRNHDPQIGRFIQIDPLSEKYVYNSTYAFSENKVTSHVELEGLEAVWADNNVERDIRDVSSGKISRSQLEERVAVRAGASKAFTVAVAIGGTIAAGIMVPGFAQAASIVLAAEVFGFPSPTSPTSMTSTVLSESRMVASELSTVASASDDVVSLATKARVFEAGGEIGMMQGGANLAVDAKTGFFNIQVAAGTEAGIITGEINVSKGAIGFTNLEITNAKGGLGSIGMQNTIGSSTFMNLQKELTELVKAGGYNNGYIEFSRLRPVGSKLPDTDTRRINLVTTSNSTSQ